MSRFLMFVLIFYGVAFWIANIFLCDWLACEKNRSGRNWVVLSLFFGILATLVLIGAPVKGDEDEEGEEER